MRNIEWTTRALRQLRKIHGPKNREAVYGAATRLIDFPNVQNIKKSRQLPVLQVESWKLANHLLRIEPGYHYRRD